MHACAATGIFIIMSLNKQIRVLLMRMSVLDRFSVNQPGVSEAARNRNCNPTELCAQGDSCKKQSDHR